MNDVTEQFQVRFMHDGHNKTVEKISDNFSMTLKTSASVSVCCHLGKSGMKG